MAIRSHSTLLTIDRAAAFIGVSHQGLRNWINEGVPEVQPKLFVNDRHGVYTKEDVERLRRYAEVRLTGMLTTP